MTGESCYKRIFSLASENYNGYSDSNFALEISAMDYGTQHKLQFAYRMDAKGNGSALKEIESISTNCLQEDISSASES